MGIHILHVDQPRADPNSGLQARVVATKPLANLVEGNI